MLQASAGYATKLMLLLLPVSSTGSDLGNEINQRKVGWLLHLQTIVHTESSWVKPSVFNKGTTGTFRDGVCLGRQQWLDFHTGIILNFYSTHCLACKYTQANGAHKNGG